MAADLHGFVLGILIAEKIDDKHLHDLRDALRRHGARLHNLGVGALTIRTRSGADLVTDVQVKDVAPGYYDGLIVPAVAPIRDESLIELVQALAELRRPLGALGEGLLLLSEAGIVRDRRVAAKGSVRDAAVRAGAIGTEEAIVVDRFLVTASDSRAVEPFCKAFGTDVEAYRKRDYVDEVSMESFPGSDSASGAAI